MRARKLTILGIPVLTAALMAPLQLFALDESEFRLLGLALHQDTGRDIYLGGIHFPEGIPRPDDLVSAAGPKAMEYRIVTRRTSMRSLLGGMMLQSELATGESPSAETTRFANDIISAVRGSLYAGDSFRILLTEDDSTVALLNGEQLASIENGFVADYFLEGWLGEKGATTTFREDISRDQASDPLLTLYQQHEVSAERLAAVQAWTEEQSNSQMVAVSEVAEPPPEPEQAPVAEASETIAEELAVPQPGAAELALASVTATAIAVEPELSPVPDTPPGTPEVDVMAVAEPAPEPEPESVPEQVQVASIAPMAGLEDARPEEELGAADMIQYSQRLAEFNTDLLRLVYGAVHYPKAAVRRGLQGTLEIDLVLSAEGELREVAVARSSGYKILDEAAMRAAKRAFKGEAMAGIDAVVNEEYGSEDGQLIIPLPVKFVLTE